MSIIHSSPGDLLLAAAHPETGPPAPLTGDLLPAVAHPKSQAPSILTGGFAPCGRTSQKPGSEYPHRGICSLRSHIPARLAAGFAKGYKKAARTSSAASLYPFAVRGGFEPPVR